MTDLPDILSTWFMGDPPLPREYLVHMLSSTININTGQTFVADLYVTNGAKVAQRRQAGLEVAVDRGFPPTVFYVELTETVEGAQTQQYWTNLTELAINLLGNRVIAEDQVNDAWDKV